MAETTSEKAPRNRNDWSTRTDAKLLRGRKGKVHGDLKELDTILGADKADDEDMESGKDIFAMNEFIGNGDKGEKLNTYKMEERQAMRSPLRSSEMQDMEKSGKSLLSEITGDLGSLGSGIQGKHKFWMEKAFFRKHMGLS